MSKPVLQEDHTGVFREVVAVVDLVVEAEAWAHRREEVDVAAGAALEAAEGMDIPEEGEEAKAETHMALKLLMKRTVITSCMMTKDMAIADTDTADTDTVDIDMADTDMVDIDMTDMSRTRMTLTGWGKDFE